jgi:8-oxo-dGTP pyrophosphatase MutT (NUDIX family)
LKFDQFKKLIDPIQQIGQIGEKAHEVVFPEIAKFRKKSLALNPNPRLSAVGAIFIPKEEDTHIVLIERQSYKGVHSGQIGFPGGKVEHDDRDFEYTARRETEEEVGIQSEKLVKIGQLTELYIPPSRFLVKPYLFMLDYTPQLVAQPREVKSILSLPVEVLMRPEIFVEGEVPTSNGVQLHSKYIPLEGKKIWGATAMMLSELQILLHRAIKTQHG